MNSTRNGLHYQSHDDVLLAILTLLFKFQLVCVDPSITSLIRSFSRPPASVSNRRTPPAISVLREFIMPFDVYSCFSIFYPINKPSRFSSHCCSVQVATTAVWAVAQKCFGLMLVGFYFLLAQVPIAFLSFFGTTALLAARSNAHPQNSYPYLSKM